MTERRILERVNHPFIIKMYGAFVSVRFITLTSKLEALSTFSTRILSRWRVVLPVVEM